MSQAPSLALYPIRIASPPKSAMIPESGTRTDATAEKQLLEQTLSGCLRVLSEVLSLVNPAAFSRAERARRYIHHVVTAMKLGNPWQHEVAAILSQLGCVTLTPETIEAIYRAPIR